MLYNYILNNCVSDQTNEMSAIGATYILFFIMKVATHKVMKKYNYKVFYYIKKIYETKRYDPLATHYKNSYNIKYKVSKSLISYYCKTTKKKV